jgi:signal transduction histidine kinase
MLRFTFASLRFRLLLLVLLAVVPALGLTLYTNVELRRLAAADAKEEALRLARIATSGQEDMIKDTRQLLFALTQLPEVRSTDPTVCSGFLARLLKQYPQYALLGVIAPGGDLFCSALPASSPVNLAHHNCFQHVLQTRDFAVSGYQSDRSSGKATLDFGYPVLDEAGQVRAVVFASLDLTWLNQLAAEAQLPQGSTFTVIDRNGIILVRYPDPGIWVGRSVPEAPIVETMLTQQGEGTAEAYGVDGIPRLFAFTPLASAPGNGEVYVSIGIPTAVAFANANRVLAFHLAGLGLVTVLALAAAWLGSNLFILRQVKLLVNATKRLNAGDLSARTGLPYGKGELSQLARAFDEMAESLEQAHQMLEQRVAARTRELSALYDVTAVASASLDLETVLESSLERVLAAMGSEVGTIHLLDETKKVLRLAAKRGIPPDLVAQIDPVPMDSGLAGWVTEHGEPLVAPNIAAGPRPLLAVPARDSQAYVGVSIRAKGQVLGVLSVIGETGRQFKVEEVTLLASIADEVGVAVENARLYQQAEQLAVMRERERLARELHDSVTQSLYSLTLLAEAGQRLAGAGDLQRVEEAVTRLGEIGQQALKEMRLLVYELRPLALRSEGLVGALQQRLDAVERRASVEACLLVEGEVELPSSMEEELYRIAQEALNNALKHAAPTSVTVHVRGGDEYVELEIVDDGRGFDPDTVSDRGGMGLTSMRERAEKLGGSLTVLSAPGEGTRIKVSVGVRTPASPRDFLEVFP